MRPKFPISDKAFEEACHILLLLIEHLPEVPVSLLRSMRPQPENPRGGDVSALDFAEPRLGPVLVVTREDLEQFDPRDWEDYFRSFSTTERPFPMEIALAIALAALSLVLAFMATKACKRRRGGRGRGGGGRSGSGGGGGGSGGSPRGGGLLSLVPRRGAALLTRRVFEDAGRRSGLAEADGVVWLARVAATGTSRTRGRVRAEIELTQRMIAGLRQASSDSQSQEGVALKISNLSSYAQKRVRTDPVDHLAAIPEWKTALSEAETDDYKAATLAKLGTTVCPLNQTTEESDKMRKELVDRCTCSHPGSEDCVRVHVCKAMSWIKDQLGEEAFRNCGLDAMGEQVAELLASVNRKKLENLDKLVPQNKPQNFMEIATKELGQTETKDLAKYYYNVFLPRRLASLTRAEHKNDEVVDWEDEKSDQEDDRNDRSPRKKSKTSGSSSSTRCRK